LRAAGGPPRGGVRRRRRASGAGGTALTAEADDGRLIDDDPKSQARRCRVASRERSRMSSPGTWTDSPSQVKTAWSSSALEAAGCVGRGSARPGPRPGTRSAPRPALSRPSPCRQHDGGRPGCKSPRAKERKGALQLVRRAHLPARHPGARRGHRRGHGQAAAAGPPQSQEDGRAGTDLQSATQRARGRKRASRRLSRIRWSCLFTWAWNSKSGRRESNPHDQLGRLGLYH
jgi:hypothetical protein